MWPIASPRGDSFRFGSSSCSVSPPRPVGRRAGAREAGRSRIRIRTHRLRPLAIHPAAREVERTRTPRPRPPGLGGGLLSHVPLEPEPKGPVNGHWAALDGMRAFAVIAVMLFHFQQPHFFLGGYVGVDVFFVLSGFLITSLLISERDQFGTVWVRGFYARRALRLFPALALVVVSCAGIVLILGDLSGRRHDTLVGIPFATFFVGNWVLGLADSLKLGLLNHTWSLGIEEQFYLLWPITLVVLLRRVNRDVDRRGSPRSCRSRIDCPTGGGSGRLSVGTHLLPDNLPLRRAPGRKRSRAPLDQAPGPARPWVEPSRSGWRMCASRPAGREWGQHLRLGGLRYG